MFEGKPVEFVSATQDTTGVSTTTGTTGLQDEDDSTTQSSSSSRFSDKTQYMGGFNRGRNKSSLLATTG